MLWHAGRQERVHDTSVRVERPERIASEQGARHGRDG